MFVVNQDSCYQSQNMHQNQQDLYLKINRQLQYFMRAQLQIKSKAKDLQGHNGENKQFKPKWNYFLQGEQLKQKMNDQTDSSSILQNRMTSPKKQNLPLHTYGTPINSSCRFVKSTNLHSIGQAPSRILQTQWINVTPQPLNSRPSSPKNLGSYPATQLRDCGLIQLGGSKQKRQREKAESIAGEETRRNELSASETLTRRISMLESRVKELHMEKQQLAVELNQKNKGLESQNERLVSIIRGYEGKKFSQTPQGEDEFNLQEMLANQININLSLREQIENLNNLLETERNKASLQTSQLNTISEQNSVLKLQFSQLQDSSQDQAHALEEEIKLLQQDLSKKEHTVTQIVQEKQKRILQLEEQLYTLNSQLSQNRKQKGALNQQLQTLKSSANSDLQELSLLRTRVCQLQKPAECKKCKDLLHTVFRLNSQLNRK